MLAPNAIISKSKELKQLKAKILKTFKRAAALSTQGPFYKLTIWFGKNGFRGRLVSKCQPPTRVKPEPSTCTEAWVTWVPTKSGNPFHEEQYVVAWKHITENSEENWHVKTMTEGDYEVVGKRLKIGVDALPENAKVRIRVCAVNYWGRSDWSQEHDIITFAKPRPDGGYWGPLGPACIRENSEDRHRYRWRQIRGSVEIKIPIPEDWTAKEIRLKHTQTKLEFLLVKDGAPPPTEETGLTAAKLEALRNVILTGTLFGKVKVDEVFWQIDVNKEDGRHIACTMTKGDVLVQWKAALDGDEHPQIDSTYVPLMKDGLTENIDWIKENNPR